MCNQHKWPINVPRAEILRNGWVRHILFRNGIEYAKYWKLVFLSILSGRATACIFDATPKKKSYTSHFDCYLGLRYMSNIKLQLVFLYRVWNNGWVRIDYLHKWINSLLWQNMKYTSTYSKKQYNVHLPMVVRVGSLYPVLSRKVKCQQVSSSRWKSVTHYTPVI